MPIPDAERAIASRERIHDYLLNPEHPDGGSKAAWFGSLGYEQHDWQTVWIVEDNDPPHLVIAYPDAS